MEHVAVNGWTEKIPENKWGINGSTLKLIAIIVMLIDHVGAVIVERMIVQINGGGIWVNGLGNTNVQPELMKLIVCDVTLRSIGRLAFPIFCFLLIEGFLHTRNVCKYACRLFVFALISEIPFNLAISGKVFTFAYQNVFFTLLIGLFVMIAYSYIDKIQKSNVWKKILRMVFYLLSFAAGMVLAELLNTDYAATGVFGIMMLYIFRRWKATQMIAGCLSFSWEVTAPLAFLPIFFYNGKRGLRLKYAFYIFYPLHLSILYLIAYAMGIA